MRLEKLGRGCVWFDAGTAETLMEAACFIETVEKHESIKIACPEEIAFHLGLIDAEQVARLAEPLRKNSYYRYLLELIKGGA